MDELEGLVVLWRRRADNAELAFEGPFASGPALPKIAETYRAAADELEIIVERILLGEKPS